MKRRGFLAGLAALAIAPRIGMEDVARLAREEPHVPLGRFLKTETTFTSGPVFGIDSDAFRAALFTSESP